MARSEFRWNKKRKHYSYLYKDIGTKRKNILISTKSEVKSHKKNKSIKTIPLYRHPNTNKKGQFYLVPRTYADEIDSFDEHVYKNWKWDKNDKRKVKRIIKKK